MFDGNKYFIFIKVVTYEVGNGTFCSVARQQKFTVHARGFGVRAVEFQANAPTS
jgi:hypothetical protein